MRLYLTNRLNTKTMSHTILNRAPLLLFNSHRLTVELESTLRCCPQQRLILLHSIQFFFQPFISIDRLNWLKGTIDFVLLFGCLYGRRTKLKLIDRLITLVGCPLPRPENEANTRMARNRNRNWVMLIEWIIDAAMLSNVNCNVRALLMPPDNWIHRIFINVSFDNIYSH